MGMGIAGSARTWAGVFVDRGVLGAGVTGAGAGSRMGDAAFIRAGVVDGPASGIASGIASSVSNKTSSVWRAAGDACSCDWFPALVPVGGVRTTAGLEGMNARDGVGRVRSPSITRGVEAEGGLARCGGGRWTGMVALWSDETANIDDRSRKYVVNK